MEGNAVQTFTVKGHLQVDFEGAFETTEGWDVFPQLTPNRTWLSDLGRLGAYVSSGVGIPVETNGGQPKGTFGAKGHLHFESEDALWN